MISTFWGSFASTAKAEVANDFQASVMAPLTKITDWNAFKNQLKTLKDNGVYALTTDVWWGDVEAAGDNQFDWSYYKTYADAVSQSGLKWVPILSTHKCGGNPGDDCNIPIPSWLWSKAGTDVLQYKSETGFVNNEALSPFWSGVGQQYNELYASFAANFASYKGLIPKIYLSGGPSGELRYPSYYMPAGWSYPARGKFQVYTETAKAAFRSAMMTKYGSINGVNQAWGLQLTSDSQINPPSDGDSFYSTSGYNSTYGKDFLSWYQSVLENHLGVIAAAAHTNFDSVFGVRIGAKISGIHWQMNNPAAPHSAEHAAGYYDYNRLVQKFKETDLDLTFTALEMHDSGTSPQYSQPSTLVDTISSTANSKGVRLNGENALPTGDFQKIEQQITKWNYNGFTLLRLGNLVNSDGSASGNMSGFKQFVISHAKKPVDDITPPSVPTNLAASGVTGSSATLNWTASTDAVGVTGYEIWRDGAKIATSATNSYTNTGLTADSTYSYAVKAYDAAGNISGASAAISVKTGTTTSNNVTIYYKRGYATPFIHYRPAGGTWTTPPGAAMPQAEASAPGYNKFTVNIGSAAQLEAVFNNGSGTWDNNNSKNYLFSAGTWNYTPGANGAPGTIKQGPPAGIDITPPSVPTNLAASGVTASSATLNWTASTDAVGVTGYEIWRDGAKIATSAANSYTNAGLTADTTYSYTVKAYDAAGNISAASAAISVKTGTAAGNTVTVYYKRGYATPYIHYRPAGGTWTTPPGAAMPQAEASASGYNKFTVNIGSATQLEAVFNNGSGTWDNNNSKNYLFSAGTWDYTPGANGAPGTITPRTTAGDDLTPPTAPTNVAAAGTTDTTVSLSWSASTDNVKVTGYDVYRNGNKVGTTTTGSFTDSGLTPETSYTYTVKAFDAAKNVSDASAPATAATTKKPVDNGSSKAYSTNPTFGKRTASPITIDGTNTGEWTDANLIAVDAANDDPRTLGSNWTLHETPMDLSHLWASWDNDNLYLAWQYVDVTDVVDPANAGSAGGTPIRSMDMPQTIAIDTTPGAGAVLDMWKKNGNKPMWGGTELPDYQINIASNMFHTGYISKAVNGVFPVDDAGVNYKTGAAAGIVVKFKAGNAAASLWGAKDVDDVNTSSKLVDFLTLGHSAARDTFYEAKIPLSAIGNPNLELAGIGVKLHQGEFSPVDSIPNDPATSDTPGISESNSPKEWGDTDLLTTGFARIGK
nr:family 14 glycosylhydrolase [Paenibacillus caseinilyticus]